MTCEELRKLFTERPGTGPTRAETAMAVVTLEIPGWMPATLNKVMRGHWSNGHKCKLQDRGIIAAACLGYGLKGPCEYRRRVDLLIVLPRGQRAPDPDAFWKSLLDALVFHGLLRNDSSAWCEPGRVRFARGEDLRTFITLVDIP